MLLLEGRGWREEKRGAVSVFCLFVCLFGNGFSSDRQRSPGRGRGEEEEEGKKRKRGRRDFQASVCQRCAFRNPEGFRKRLVLLRERRAWALFFARMHCIGISSFAKKVRPLSSFLSWVFFFRQRRRRRRRRRRLGREQNSEQAKRRHFLFYLDSIHSPERCRRSSLFLLQRMHPTLSFAPSHAAVEISERASERAHAFC